MATVAINEKLGIRLTASKRGTVRKYSVPLFITTDDVLDGPAEIYASGALNAYLGAYAVGNDSDLAATLQEFTLERVGGEERKLWQANFEYSNELDLGEPPTPVENPLDRPVEISYSFSRYQEAVDTDRDGNAILNSAGDRYVDPLEIDAARFIITCVRNEETFDVAAWVNYQDTINEFDWFGLEPGQGKVAIAAQKQFEGDFVYFSVTYEFEIRWKGWQPPMLEQGFRAWTAPASGVKMDITENYWGGTRQKVTIPALLNADGTENLDDPPVATYSDPKLVYRETDFNDFNLV